MGGSYHHVVADDGQLLSNLEVVGMLETGGDVFEAVEQMYGMIWWLASKLAVAEGSDAASLVAAAVTNFKAGLAESPGTEGFIRDEEE
jgi:hypothetical protein